MLGMLASVTQQVQLGVAIDAAYQIQLGFGVDCFLTDEAVECD